MLKNDDRLAQPARGRFFPFTVGETIKFLRDLGFAVPSYRKRPNITFRNLETVGSYGRIVAAVYSADEMIIYPVPEDLDCQRARQMLESTFREFAELEKSTESLEKPRTSLSFRAYHSPLGKLVITKRIRRARFSTTFKPKSLKKDEQVVRTIDLV